MPGCYDMTDRRVDGLSLAHPPTIVRSFAGVFAEHAD
jgi:hypothetical protein